MGNLESPPRTAELWPLVRDRIATTRMATILGGTGRVWVEGDEPDPPWSGTTPGGRVVVVPGIDAAGGGAWTDGLPLRLRFLIRSDFSEARPAGYDVSTAMEAAQREAFDRLQDWVPALNTMTRAMVAFPVYLTRTWQPRALYDLETQGIIYVSSEYAVDVADHPTP